MKSGLNLSSPIIGAAIGTGIGLLLFGTNTYLGPLFLLGTELGLVSGFGVAGIGTAIDLYTRADCNLHTNLVYFQLVEEN